MSSRNNIRKWRERNRFTLKALASELDIDISTLNRMENGIIKQFKPETLLKLSQLFNCTVEKLFIEHKKEAELLSTKEQLYQQLIAMKDKRIEDLQRQLGKVVSK